MERQKWKERSGKGATSGSQIVLLSRCGRSGLIGHFGREQSAIIRQGEIKKFTTTCFILLALWLSDCQRHCLALCVLLRSRRSSASSSAFGSFPRLFLFLFHPNGQLAGGQCTAVLAGRPKQRRPKRRRLAAASATQMSGPGEQFIAPLHCFLAKWVLAARGFNAGQLGGRNRRQRGGRAAGTSSEEACLWSGRR